MKYTEFFIKNPIIIWGFAILVLSLGIVCYHFLSVTALPPISEDSIVIQTNYSGGSANFVSNEITRYISEAVRNLDGVDTVISSSKYGMSYVTVTFKPNVQVNRVINDIQNALSLVKNKLPPNTNTPSIIKTGVDSDKIITIGVYSSQMPVSQLSSYVTDNIVNRLQTVSGVSQIVLTGAQQLVLHIYLNSKRMAVYNIDTATIANVINAANKIFAGGKIENQYQEMVLTTLSLPDTLFKVRNLIIKSLPNDTSVRLKDIANIQIEPLDPSAMFRVNGIPGIGVSVLVQHNANIIEISKKIRNTLSSIQKQLPSSVHIKEIYNLASYVSASTHKVYMAIIEATILITLLTFIFIGSLRLALIPLIAIPISIFTTFIIMYFAGFSLNVMTLMALLLSIGLVVDDAIVVLENTSKYIDQGQNTVDASIRSNNELWKVLIAMTITLAIVYTPIAFVGKGIVGSLIKPFAFTLAVLVIISGLISLTLTPVMCSQFMSKINRTNKFHHLFAITFVKVKDMYSSSLSNIINNWRWLIVIILLVLGLASYALYNSLPSEMRPVEDRGMIITVFKWPFNANINYVQKKLERIESIESSVTDGKNIFSEINYPYYSAFSVINLRDFKKRHKSIQSWIHYLTVRINKANLSDVFVFQGSPLNVSASRPPIKLVVNNPGSYLQLYEIVNSFLKQLKSTHGLYDISSNLKFNMRQINLSINHNLTGDLGISPYSIAAALSLYYGEQKLDQDFLWHNKMISVYMGLPKNDKQDLTALDILTVKSGVSNEMLPISSLVKLRYTAMPYVLLSFNGLPAAIITAQIKRGLGLGSAMKQINKIANKILPSSASFTWLGESRQYLESNTDLLLIISLALIFIYFSLTLQFKNMLDPLIILLTVPLSFFGAVLFLKLFGGTLNLYTKVGLLTLIGLITKHGILIIEIANRLRAKGFSLHDAIIEASAERFRPILMTTFAMIFGALPMALISGEGSNALSQIGWTIVGGMMFGTFFSLFAIPTAYVILHDLKGYFNNG